MRRVLQTGYTIQFLFSLNLVFIYLFIYLFIHLFKLFFIYLFIYLFFFTCAIKSEGSLSSWFKIVTGVRLLVIRLVWKGYGLYLVEEPVHGEAKGRTVYGVSETRYNPYPFQTNLMTNLSYPKRMKLKHKCRA